MIDCPDARALFVRVTSRLSRTTLDQLDCDLAPKTGSRARHDALPPAPSHPTISMDRSYRAHRLRSADESGGNHVHFGRSIRTTFEFCRERSKTISFPSGVISNVLKTP